ncbi:sigma-54-dependent transcriptional regulator [Sorangium sp. So ce1097]|uniref:sigma-54-dependent transcriptional regulator n=1 Tax=Sorangium sp. So ce1097 TaxID=3133330 RepID=UPI003F623634
MDPGIASLVTDLAAATTFEDAAERLLRALLHLAAETLARSPFARRGRLLRGMVHLRPADGYRRLVVLDQPDEPSARASSGGAEPPSLVPSATAWRWVVEHRCGLSIDVHLGVIQLQLAGAAPILRDSPPSEFDTSDTRRRLLGREASHVLVLPLRSPGGAIEGMISLEASCRAASGLGFIWSECLPAIQLFSDVASPYLAALPLRRVVTPPADEFLPVIGSSMAGIVEMLRVFAQQEETILLSGPTGVGKSRLARWTHEQSEQRSRPFETLDLATVPEELQMAELFGWKKGSFTGAVRDTAGCIARAEGGTLFIDEIDKLSLKAQAGLLRVLEERKYRPLGEGAGDRSAQVRFVIGTNADLHAAVRAGRFREDLYYRINVLPVHVPPLTERADEIPRWAAYMLDRRHRARSPDGEARLAPDAEPVLLAHGWPGNLRQLDNIVRRAYALALMEVRGPAREVVLGGRHLARALAYEAGAGPRSLVELFQLTAAEFVRRAEQKRAQGAVLDLDLAEALRGFVLATAVEKLGSREEAFRLLGKESVVQNRNHQKTLKREIDRVEALCKALGEAGAPFKGLAEDERER